MAELVVEGRLERRDANQPCFVRVPAAALAPWHLAGPLELTAELGGHELGRRILKRYDSGTWMVELAAIHLRWAGLAPGDAATLTLRMPDLPVEPAPPEPPARRPRAKKRPA